MLLSDAFRSRSPGRETPELIGGSEKGLRAGLQAWQAGPSPLFCCRRVQRHPFERIATPFQVYSWTAPQAEHAMDCVRAEDAYTSRLGYEEHIPGQVPAARPRLPWAPPSPPLVGARRESLRLPGRSICLSVLFTWELMRLSMGRWRKGLARAGCGAWAEPVSPSPVPPQTRDWNEELQTTRELPRKNLPERLLRERAIFKVPTSLVPDWQPHTCHRRLVFPVHTTDLGQTDRVPCSTLAGLRLLTDHPNSSSWPFRDLGSRAGVGPAPVWAEWQGLFQLSALH